MAQEDEIDETVRPSRDERDLQELQQADGIADIEEDDATDVDVDMDAELETEIDADSEREDTPELEGRTPLPEELTGRASGTDEDLVALFDNQTNDHMTDGFRGGSTDEPPVDDDEMLNDAAQGSP